MMSNFIGKEHMKKEDNNYCPLFTYLYEITHHILTEILD